MPKRGRSAGEAGDEADAGDAAGGKRAKQDLILLAVAVRMTRKHPKRADWADGRLQLDHRRLVFEYGAGSGKPPVEVMRDRVADCMQSAKNSALVKVIVNGESRPLYFDMMTVDAAATVKESLRARSAEELAAETEAEIRREAREHRAGERVALGQRLQHEREAYLEAHAEVRERFNELVKTNRLHEDDFWSDRSVRHAQLVWALGVLHPEEEPNLAGEDNIIRINYERAVLPRLLACQPALKEVHRKLVLEGDLNERVFWQIYICVRHTLDPADLPGVSRSANSENERRQKEADLEQATAAIKEAVQIDSRMRLEEEELELTSDPRDGMELLVRGASRASSGSRYRKGYGLVGENAEAFFSGQAMQSSGRQHAPDILRQLNMAGDHVVLQQLFGQGSLRHLPPSSDDDDDEDALVDSRAYSGVKRFARRARDILVTNQLQTEQAVSESQYSRLDIFDAEFCYAQRCRPVPSVASLAGSPRSVSAPSTEATALTLTLSGGGGWRPDPKRRVADVAAVGTPRATAFDPPTRADNNSWRTIPPAGSPSDDNGNTTKDQVFKTELCKFARIADTLLAQFWIAIQENDQEKVKRLGAYGEYGNGSLERLFEEVQEKFSQNATVSKSLYASLNHAFEAFVKFKQQEVSNE